MSCLWLQSRLHLLTLLAVITAGSTSMAQTDVFSGSEPVFSQEDFDAFLEQFPLIDEPSRVLLRHVYDEYIANHRAEWSRVRDQLEVVRQARLRYREESGDSAAMRSHDGDDFGYGGIRAAWERRRFDIAGAFEDDARVVLADEHVAAWDQHISRVHRKQWRRRVDPTSYDPGLDDLSVVLEEIEFGEGEALSDIVPKYLEEYDAALRHAAEAVPIIIEQEFEGPAGQFAENVRAIHEVNMRFIATVKSALSVEAGQELERYMLMRVMPGLFESSIVDEVLSQLSSSIEVGPAIREELNGIYSRYLSTRDRLRKSVVRGCFEWGEPKKSREREAQYSELLRLQREGHNVDPEQAKAGHPAMKYLKELLVLEDRTCLEIQNLLRNSEVNAPQAVEFLLTWPSLDD